MKSQKTLSENISGHYFDAELVTSLPCKKSPLSENAVLLFSHIHPYIIAKLHYKILQELVLLAISSALVHEVEDITLNKTVGVGTSRLTDLI